MFHSTSITYQMKREILTFSNKISRKLPKPERTFISDMNYGILVSGSCLLTDITHQLHEPSRKINIVDHLSRHLAKGTPKDALKALRQNSIYSAIIGKLKERLLTRLLNFPAAFLYLICPPQTLG